MKQLFAYIRVSTERQGQGVSLQEQRSAIERYVTRAGAEIIQWFEERKTAAKTGRPEFARMLQLLRARKAQGIVIHKIDRSTRNYRDWADIDELIESGIDVFFANDDVDLRSRGGRLAADIQMVVAVDYIRNLRDEAIKGIHGRLKQGILPCGAPIGYLDRGAGQPKAIDPVRGPLVRRLFEDYSGGSVTLRQLTETAMRLGLRNRRGQQLRVTQLQKMVRNPFYAGVIRSTRFGLFPGAHEPIVRRATFDRVQEVLDGKRIRRTKRFSFPFRRLIRCATCRRSLVGSERKGFIYYRCQVVDCLTTSLREDAIEVAIGQELQNVTLAREDLIKVEEEIRLRFDDETALKLAQRSALEEALTATTARLNRLTDLLLDRNIDSHTHDEKRLALLADRSRIEQQLATVAIGSGDLKRRVERILELVKSASTLFESAEADQKRRLVEIMFSGCNASGKSLELNLREPFASIARRHVAGLNGSRGSAERDLSADELIRLSTISRETLGLDETPANTAPFTASG